MVNITYHNNKKEKRCITISYSTRTDLAIEAHDMYTERTPEQETLSGVYVETERFEDSIEVTRVRITDNESAERLGKKCGRYVTIDMPRDFDGEQETYERVCKVVAIELSKLIELKEKDTVLIVGLGNWNITADALGPKVVDGSLITRHLLEHMPEEIDERLRPVCAISPGVLGLTGIETGEITLGVVDRVKPSLVIAIDALCSRKMERINTTIQLADTGITPGSGIGNKRMCVNEETLGVPVIAIGVPTVIDAATIAEDAINLTLAKLKENSGEDSHLYKILTSVEEEDRYALIKEVISPVVGDMIVAPKDVDLAIDKISSVIYNGINISLHEGISFEDIDRYRV